MSRPLWAAALTAALLAGSAGSLWANPEEVTVGMLRSPVDRAGIPLRAEARMSSASLGQIPHGTRLTVQEVAGNPLWLRVTTQVTQADGTKASKTGWIKSSATVQPYVLTGAGRGGTAVEGGTTSAAGRGFSQETTSLAGRGFDDGIEQALAKGNAAIAANLGKVDGIEQTKPSPSEVVRFANEGRLGFPGRTR